MTKNKTVRFNKKNFDDRLNAFGNTNIYRNQIPIFESKIDEEIEKIKGLPGPNFSLCPNFSAWIRLNVEFLTNKMFYDYSRTMGKNVEELNKIGFEDVKNRILDYLISNTDATENLCSELKSLLQSIELVIQLRHCIQHGGIPNIIRKIKDLDEEKLFRILDPREYKNTKSIFQSAEKFSELLPKRAIIF